MNDTNPKLDDVERAFLAVPASGRHVACAGSIRANRDFNTHVQGLAPYRTFHLLTHSDYDEPSGRVLVVSREPGKERLVSEVRLPVLSEARPYYFHPGGCQMIGDCLVVVSETGEGQSTVLFVDVSDPRHIREVNPAARVVRAFNDAGSVGVTNVTIAGKDFWVLAVYDNGATDVYLSEDAFPGVFRLVFSARVEQREHQSFSLLTDVRDRVFAIGMYRTLLFRDAAVLYEIDLTHKTITTLRERQFRARGPDDLFGSGAHFRWGAGIEIASATELAIYCAGWRLDDGLDLNVFRGPTPRARRPSRARARRKR
jgi:hypothetical protein